METMELVKEVKGNIGTLKINRPDRGNALSPSLLMDLHLTLKRWAEEDDIRAVVITGNSDKAFSSGYDILSIPTDITPEAAEILKKSNPLELALESVKNYPYPVIAMINGYCFGAGLNLAICCDIRIGADHIKAGMPPAKLGLVYHPEGLKQFIEVIGMTRTREIFFSAHTYKGAELREMGLVDHMYPMDKLSDAVYDMAEEISQNAPLSVKGMKTIINMIENRIPMSSEDMRTSQTLIEKSFNSHDLKEGQAAFIEKRKPVFLGK